MSSNASNNEDWKSNHERSSNCNGSGCLRVLNSGQGTSSASGSGHSDCEKRKFNSVNVSGTLASNSTKGTSNSYAGSGSWKSRFEWRYLFDVRSLSVS